MRLTSPWSPSRRALCFVLLLLPLTLNHACGPEIAVERADDVTEVSNPGVASDAPALESLTPVWQAGTVEGDQMYFSSVMSVDFDDQGNAYALDFRDQVVSKLDGAGNLLTQFAGPGQGPGELSKSRSLTWWNGQVLVANEGNGRIEVFTDEGEALDPVRLEAVSVPSYVFFKEGSFYVGKQFVPEGHFLYRYDVDWSAAEALKPAEPMEDRLDFLRSHHLPCPAPDGTWLVYLLLDKIEKIDDQGETVLRVTRELDWDFPKDERGEVVPEILVTRRCAVDPAGNLYVIYSNPEDWKRGNDVFKFAPDGRLLGRAFTLPVHRATSMTFDAAGDLYYSDGVTLYKATVAPADGGNGE